ncbi:MAG: YgiT-type zinc finger protein [Bacteroidetes bacterium]|nr:MAG: YgiT-type zinc finger protein [Bacteroidota bacterium]
MAGIVAVRLLKNLKRLTSHSGKLFILENIPTGVCTQCGEKFFTAEISKKMEALVITPVHPMRTTAIPVLTI